MSKPDAPIGRLEHDQLQRGPLVAHLRRILISGRAEQRRATQLTVGLTGSWGSGKSSVLRLLHDDLSRLANVFVVEFNPWIFEGRNDLLEAFFVELSNQLGPQPSDDLRSVLVALDRYREAIDPSLKTILPGSEFVAKLIPRVKLRSALARRRQLEARLKELKGAVVVLVDELDRVEAPEVRAMARVIKAIGDLPNISYLVAFDRERVERALGEGDASLGAAYLEKVIQFSVPLRPLIVDEVRDLLVGGLVEAGYPADLHDSPFFEEALERLSPILDTPRDVKRMLSSFTAMEPMVGTEVNTIDVLCYAALATKAAALRDVIADEIDAVVNDPAGLKRMMERGRPETRPTVERVFGADVPHGTSELLTFLFPALREGSARDTIRFGRIQQRRNLLTMLYLGDPPFQISRREIEEFWANPNREVLTAYRADGRMSDFIGQVYRLLPDLPAAGDPNAWLTLAAHLGEGDPRARVEARNIARDLREVLVDFGSRGEIQRERAQAVIDALRQAGDFALLPDILRYHMFAFGLVADQPARDRPTVLSEQETKQLLAAEIPRYREWVLSGQWLVNVEDADPLFAIEQSGSWDAELRQSAEDQLVTPNALAHFAAIMVAPGWVVERGTLERFVSEGLLRERLAEIAVPEDPVLADSVARLIGTLAGHAPEHL